MRENTVIKASTIVLLRSTTHVDQFVNAACTARVLMAAVMAASATTRAYAVHCMYGVVASTGWSIDAK